MIKIVLWTGSLLLVGYGGICVFLYVSQRSMLYYPVPAVNAPLAEVYWLNNDGLRLKIWRLGRGNDRALFYFGGNAENVALNLPQFARLFPDYDVFLMNYRGYGGSTGQPTESGLCGDAEALYDAVAAEYRFVAAIGRSLGTGIATHLASTRPLDKLVLVTPYDSMVNLASSYYPFIPVRLLLKDRYDSTGKAAVLRIPVLVVIAELDEVIPRRVSDALVAVLDPGRTSVAVIAGAGHNSIGEFADYEQRLSSFLNVSD